jgi:hypothetical protein
MATIPCSSCQVGTGAYILTNLQTGEAPVLCEECFPDFIISIAQSLMESGYGVQDEPDGHVDAPEVAEGREAYESATEAAEPDPTPPTPTNGRSRPKSAPVATDTGDGFGETSEAVAASTTAS